MSVEFDKINEVYGIASGWQISKITTDKKSRKVFLHVRCVDESGLTCPKCDRVCSVYDRRPRTWCHLDTGEYRTYVVTALARVKCLEHGVRTIAIPWAS